MAHSTILTMAEPLAWKAWEELQYSVETGKPAVDKVFGMSLFDFLAQPADQAARFSETMVSVHGPEPSAVAEALRFLGNAQEYRTLLAGSGLRMTRVVPTASNASIVEAELA